MLRRRAEEAADKAREIYGNNCPCHGCDRDKGCDFAPMVADLVEREAKRFAERALRQVVKAWQHPNMQHTYLAGGVIARKDGLIGLGYGTMKDAEAHRDYAIAEAIAAAEAGDGEGQ